VSVSLEKRTPRASISRRSVAWFSMMPLWTTATGPDVCGCALRSVGRPCVAHRVWPMPVLPRSGFFFSVSARCTSLPTARTISIPRPVCTARPAES